MANKATIISTISYSKIALVASRPPPGDQLSNLISTLCPAQIKKRSQSLATLEMHVLEMMVHVCS